MNKTVFNFSRHLRVLLFACVALLSASRAVAGGLESDELGAYLISSPQDLLDFSDLVNNGASGANAVLTADLDMTGYDFTPIGNAEGTSYSGTFDGAATQAGWTWQDLLEEASLSNFETQRPPQKKHWWQF